MRTVANVHFNAIHFGQFIFIQTTSFPTTFLLPQVFILIKQSKHNFATPITVSKRLAVDTNGAQGQLSFLFQKPKMGHEKSLSGQYAMIRIIYTDNMILQ